jgi:hypothetical protein
MGGSGKCVDAHDDWLAGGHGGMMDVLASATRHGVPPFGPERRMEMKRGVLLDQDELITANGLGRCAGCRGLEDPARRHQHG